MAKTIHTEGETRFKSAGRMWTFTHSGGYSLRRDIPGGRASAFKIARIINGNFKRNPTATELDNLAKHNMFDLFHRFTKTTGLQRVAMFPSHLFSQG